MDWYQQHADRTIEASLDNNDYNEASLIELKVPLNLPYQIDWSDFERYDGNVTVDGQHYKYVKRKVQDGMLVVKCIPDENKHRIESARDQFFQLANDLQNNDGAKKSGTPKPTTVKNNITECEQMNFFTHESSTVPYIKQYIIDYTDFIVSASHSSPEQPPEA
jgi:hypothetical protein